MKSLADAGYHGILTSEACYRNGYRLVSPKNFYKVAYKRLCKLDEMLKDCYK